MQSIKLGRINEDIRLAFSAMFRDVKDPRLHQGLVSVIRADTSTDLKYCKVYVSVLNMESEKEFKRGLRSASGWFRRELGHRLSLRNVPEITFILDHSIEYGDRINRILSELDIQYDDDDSVSEGEAEDEPDSNTETENEEDNNEGTDSQ